MMRVLIRERLPKWSTAPAYEYVGGLLFEQQGRSSLVLIDGTDFADWYDWDDYEIRKCGSGIYFEERFSG